MSSKIWFWLLCFFFLASFIFRIYTYYCPDFGWHLRLGWMIFNSGIPRTDPFSFTMPSFPFVEHEWLSDLFISGIFSVFSYIGLSILFSLIALAAIVLQTIGLSKRWALFPLFLAAATLFPFLGVRPQVISWLFFSILFFCLTHDDMWERVKYFVPLLFLLWANLHGGFSAGLGIFLLAVAMRTFAEKRVEKTELILFLTSFIATGINPFGYHLWESIWQQSNDPVARNYIEEWLPSLYLNSTAFWLYTVFATGLIASYWKKFTHFELVTYGLFLLAGWWSMRHVPFWAIVALPLTIRALYYLYQDASRIKYGAERLRKAYIIFFTVVVILVLPNLWSSYQRFLYFSEQSGIFSPRAVSYLNQQSQVTRVFAPYEMGGYLLWQVPQKKVFIYGMMPSWKRETAPTGESMYAFQEYIDLLTGKESFPQAVKKYNINAVVLPKFTLQGTGSVFPWIQSYSELFGNKPLQEKNFFLSLVPSLQKLGWVKVYEDNAVIIYKSR